MTLNSNNLFLVTTEKGRHRGFLEDCLPSSWTKKLACDYLETEQHEENHVHFFPEFKGARTRSYTTLRLVRRTC